MFLSETDIPAPSPLFPFSPPSSSISRLCVLFPVLLGKNNFLCTENFILGVLSQYHCLTDAALGGTKYAKLICCRQLTHHSNVSHSTFQSLTYDITALKPSYILYQVVHFATLFSLLSINRPLLSNVPWRELGEERTGKNHVCVVLSMFP